HCSLRLQTTVYRRQPETAPRVSPSLSHTIERGKCDTHLRRSGGGRSPGLCAHGAPLVAYRGRGAVSLLPALRTVRAVLPHTALRSVVIYIEIGVQERELARG